MATEMIPVVLTSDHPHAGEHGHIVVEGGMITLIAPLGIGKATMVRVELEHCIHGEQACYAERSQLRLLTKEA